MLMLLGIYSALPARSEMKNNTKQQPFTLTSPAFEHDEFIPSKYTCDGANVSPALAWEHAPQNTQSFALIVDDPDAPTKTPWVHWIVFNIPADISELTENIEPNAFVQGATNFTNKKGWGGPCPPSGTHRYFFKLYALDTKLNLSITATKEDLLKAMEGHVLDSAELMGHYKRRKK